MRPAAHREDAHDVDLERDDGPGAEPDCEIEAHALARAEHRVAARILDRFLDDRVNGLEWGGLRSCALSGVPAMPDARGPFEAKRRSRGKKRAGSQLLCVPTIWSPSSLVKGTKGTMRPP